MTIKEFTKLSKLREDTIYELRKCNETLINLRDLIKNKSYSRLYRLGIMIDCVITKQSKITFNLNILGKFHNFEYSYKQIDQAIKDVKNIKKTLDYELNRINKQILSLEVNNV